MKKISMFFAAMLAAVCCFSSCGKDEVDVKITDVKYKGTVQFIVRGYSIGTSGTSYVPDAVRKNEYTPIEGYKITLANGQVITTDKNGKATFTTDAGEYIVDKIDIPSGYYSRFDYNIEYNYENGTYTYIYTFPENDDDYYFYDYYGNFLKIYSDYQEKIIRLYRR